MATTHHDHTDQSTERVDQGADQVRDDPMARVAADIAAADARIRAARQEQAAALRAARTPNRFSAYTIVLWRDPAGAWRRAFAANLTIPSPTVHSLYQVIDFLLESFHSVGRTYEICSAALTTRPDPTDPDPRAQRSVVAYSHVGPTR
jgi:hypothetical protein